MQNSETGLEHRVVKHRIRQHYDEMEAENDRQRANQKVREGGVLVVPTEGPWPPDGLIDDEGRINMALARELQDRDE